MVQNGCPGGGVDFGASPADESLTATYLLIPIACCKFAALIAANSGKME